MAGTDRYPRNPRSEVRRYPDRAHYEYFIIHGILKRAPIWHVAFTPNPKDPFPTILPMIGAIGVYANPNADPDDDAMDLYLHGAAAARLLKLPAATDAAGATGSASGVASEEGLPLAISATLLDGFVLALTPMHHSMNYRSAVVHGYATLVTDVDEQLWAMQYRWENTRVPPKEKELNQTGILRVRVVSASAKVRNGGPGEDKADEKDDDVRNNVWTGVVPAWIQIGEPVPAAENRVEILPPYLARWTDRANADARGTAERAVGM